MSSSEDPAIWELALSQTPPVLRWVFGILTLGLFTLATYLYRMNRDNMDRVERQIHDRIDREMGQVHNRLDEMSGHLVEIARNTRRPQ